MISRTGTVEMKLKKLQHAVRDAGSMLVAFSGGLDSTLLAKVAHDELGSKALAVTALSPTYPEWERKEAGRLARLIGIKHLFVESNELKIPGFAENPVNRCYYCKRELFTVLRKLADKKHLDVLADGANLDDRSDYRPGSRATKELRVRSPLVDAGLTKKDIRAISRKLGLPTADKPSFACLASRFPYGKRITAAGLESVDKVEQAIRALGFRQVRARYHDDIVSIEVDPSDIERLCRPKIRAVIVKVSKMAGFNHVSVDLQGYRTGSLNEGLKL